MTSLKDGDFQHSSALAQSPKGDIEPNHPSEINPNSDSRHLHFSTFNADVNRTVTIAAVTNMVFENVEVQITTNCEKIIIILKSLYYKAIIILLYYYHIILQ